MATETRQYTVLGLTCISCSEAAARNLEAHTGVAQAQVHFSTNSAEVTFDPTAVSFEELQLGLSTLGYTLVADAAEAQQAAAHYQKRALRRLLLAGAVGLPAWLLQSLGVHFQGLNEATWVLTTLVVFVAGGTFFTAAYAQALQRSISMDLLVALGIAGAWLLSTILLVAPGLLPQVTLHPESAAVVIFFVLLGRYLEDIAKNRSAQDVEASLTLDDQPVERFLSGDLSESGATEVCKAAQLRIGDTIRLPEGARIPVDGTLASQQPVFVDEAILTGEPMPVQKNLNDSVAAGTVVAGGTLLLRVTATGLQTAYAKFVAEVRRAQRTKAGTQRLIDQYVQYYVPVVGLLALGSLIGWGLLGGANGWSTGLVTALSVLIVSCPCALGLATPVVVRLGIAKAAKHSLLITNAAALEQAGRVTTVFFDKTGTLTEGQPHVEELYVAPMHVGRSGTFLPVFLSLAGQSLHPLSKALSRYLRTRHLKPTFLPTFHEEAGKGLTTEKEGERYHLGSLAWLIQEGYTVPDEVCQKVDLLTQAGLSLVAGGYNGHVVLLAGLADPIRPEAAAMVAQLHAAGVQTALLTGDHPQTAQSVAVKLGIQHVHAQLLPTDKAAHIAAARTSGATVAVVGDGLNDALALAQADLAVAMSSGTDLARQTAGVVALQGGLAHLPVLLQIGQRARRLITQNLVWALGYNVVALPLATGLFYPVLMLPAAASASMALSSLAVVLNSAQMARGWQK